MVIYTKVLDIFPRVGKTLRSLSSQIILVPLLILIAGTAAGQMDGGDLNNYYSSDNYYTISLPEGWIVNGHECNGITAQDASNAARGIVYLSRLHEGYFMLPSGTTPEFYLENYMAQDFSLGESKIEGLKMVGYEDSNFYNNQYIAALLGGFAAYSTTPSSSKAIRCNFSIDSIPTQGSFVIKTRDLYGYGTIVDYVLGIYAPFDQFDADSPILLQAFNSVQLNPEYRNICIPPVGGCTKCLDNDCCDHDCDAEGRCG